MAKTTKATVESKLRALYDLQLIDSRIDEIVNVRGELPLEVEDLENEIAGLTTNSEKISAEIEENEKQIGRLLIIILAIIGLILAYDPPDTIFNIVSQAFTGLAVLFPTTVAVLYWRRVRANSCIISILVGETIVAWSYWSTKTGNVIPEWFTQGFHISTPVIFVTIIVLWISTEIEEKLSNNAIN